MMLWIARGARIAYFGRRNRVPSFPTICNSAPRKVAGEQNRGLGKMDSKGYMKGKIAH